MKLVFYLLLNILVIGLFLYSKLLPYQAKLNPQYAKIFNFFNELFTPLLNLLRNLFKPVQVGYGLAVDMTQIILLIVLLLLMGFLR